MEYLSVENQKALAHRYKTAVVIVMGFCISVMVYMLLARILTPKEITPGSESWQQPVYSAAIVLGLVVVVLRRILLSNMMIGPAIQRGVQAILQHLFTVTLVICVLAEIAAIAGLILYFLTGDSQYSWRLSVVSLFLLAYNFPRRGEWERAVAHSANLKTNAAVQTAR
ncbi:MAG: hypothetical protein SF097_18860 [Acidobacteriota bacterium]|nr:hypothetical protein [Acidobacteriota bacterium]